MELEPEPEQKKEDQWSRRRKRKYIMVCWFTGHYCKSVTIAVHKKETKEKIIKDEYERRHVGLAKHVTACSDTRGTLATATQASSRTIFNQTRAHDNYLPLRQRNNVIELQL